MNPRFQQRIQRYGWNIATPYYAGAWADQLKPGQDALLRMLDLQPGESVLEIAAGDGLVTFPAAERIGPEGSLLATDISEGMLAALSRRAVERGFTRIRTARMGAEDLEVDEAAFDAALCAFCLMYVTDPEKAVNGILRALRPGGRCGIAVWGKRNACGWRDIFPIVAARVKSEVCPMFFQLGTGANLVRLMETCGFNNVRQETIETTLRYPNDESALTAVFEGGPVALAYAKFDDATRASARSEYLESIAPYKTDDGYAIPGQFVIATGNKPIP